FSLIIPCQQGICLEPRGPAIRADFFTMPKSRLEQIQNKWRDVKRYALEIQRSSSSGSRARKMVFDWTQSWSRAKPGDPLPPSSSLCMRFRPNAHQHAFELTAPRASRAERGMGWKRSELAREPEDDEPRYSVSL